MKVFDTISKKLAISVFALFAVGWNVYTAGLGLMLSETVEASGSSIFSTNANNPIYYPYYFTLAGGPFVVVLGVLHAALPSNRASTIVGVLSTILNNIYFVSVGFTLSFNHLFIQFLSETDNSLNLMFAGAILLTVSWSFSQILTVFYKQPQQTQSKNWWVLIVDIYKVLTGDQVWDHCMTHTEVMRLLSIPTVALSAIGWGVFVGGLHNVIQTITSEIDNSVSTFNNFATWGSIVITPFGFLIALLYAGSSGSESIFGSLVSILNSFIIVCVGYVVTYIGLILYSILENGDTADPFNIHDINLIFGGGIIFLLFWTAMMAMSRFYTHSISCRAGSTSNQLQLSPSQHDTTLNNSATPQSELQLTADPPPAYDYKQPSTVQQDNIHYVAV